MNRPSKTVIALTLLLGSFSHIGCSVCCTPWDYAYPAYDGIAPRQDRFDGRVGSAFYPAGATPGVTHPADYVPPPKPETEKPAEEPPPKSPDLMEEAAPQ